MRLLWFFGNPDWLCMSWFMSWLTLQTSNIPCHLVCHASQVTDFHSWLFLSLLETKGLDRTENNVSKRFLTDFSPAHYSFQICTLPLIYVPFWFCIFVLSFVCFFTNWAFSFKWANIIPLFFFSIFCNTFFLFHVTSTDGFWAKVSSWAESDTIRHGAFFWTYASIRWGQKRYNMFNTIVFLSSVFFSQYWL